MKHLKTYDILLYKGKDPTSRIIEWGTQSRYSHVAVVVDPAICLGVESNTGCQSGVRALDLGQLPGQEIDVFRIKPEFSFEGQKVISFLVGHLGSKYDYWGVTGLALLKGLSFLTGFKKFTGFNRFQKEKDYFCSELVYEAFLAGDLDIVPEVGDAEITSPGDIARSERLIQVTQ